MVKKGIIIVLLTAGLLLALVSCTKETEPVVPESEPVPVPLAPTSTDYSFSLPTPPPEIKLPEGTAVIIEKRDDPMGGRLAYLHIYGDGSVVLAEEKGWRPRSPKDPPIRTWKTGRIEEQEMNELLSLFKSPQFVNLDKFYRFPGIRSGGGYEVGGGSFTFHIDYENLNKTVTAVGYLPDRSGTYPDMPYPLSELYVRLRDISLKTTEVARETIPISE
jgi:hypothetical protein